MPAHSMQLSQELETYMKNRKKKLYLFLSMAALSLSQSMTALAVSEADVEAVGKETAAGNVFIWFLCAIAFLKISQKIDSFLSSLGINVGHTGVATTASPGTSSA